MEGDAVMNTPEIAVIGQHYVPYSIRRAVMRCTVDCTEKATKVNADTATTPCMHRARMLTQNVLASSAERTAHGNMISRRTV